MTRSKKDKGTILQYLIKMTEYSRQQITRLIKQYTQAGQICWTPNLNNGFDKKYQNKDTQLLAQIDERHDTRLVNMPLKNCVTVLIAYLVIKITLACLNYLFLIFII
jgi:hypothetical protein